MTGFNSKRDAAADKDALFEKFEVAQPAQPVQETKPSEIFCGVDYADGVLAVSVMRRSPDGVAEVLHSERIELAQPVQEPDLTAVYMSGLYDGKKKKRPWVGLTDDEINEWTPEIHGVIRSVDRLLQDKNA